MNERERLLQLINYYSNGNKTAFAKKLGISPQTINSWIIRNSYNVDLIYSKCNEVSSDWLLTGNGNMLRDDKPATDVQKPVEGNSNIGKCGSAEVPNDNVYKEVVNPMVSKLLELIEQKDAELRAQALEIGRLRERISLISNNMHSMRGGDFAIPNSTPDFPIGPLPQNTSADTPEE